MTGDVVAARHHPRKDVITRYPTGLPTSPMAPGCFRSKMWADRVAGWISLPR